MAGIALVTGGGRGIGAGIARALASDGFEVVVGARSLEEVERVAGSIGGRAVQLDVANPESVERAIATAGEVDLLVNNAGVADWGEGPLWESDIDEWWRVFEINVRGIHLCSRAVMRGMAERRRGRIVNVSSGASYLPATSVSSRGTSYGASKAAVNRLTEMLARQAAPHGIAVFLISPGLVRTAMTSHFPDDMPWTPPEAAPELVRKLATGRYDALAGRYLHAEHDDVDDLLAHVDELLEHDLNAIRLRR